MVPQPPLGASAANFDIVAKYRTLLADDPNMTMPIAAIQALVAALSTHDTSTTTETMTLLAAYTDKLKAGVPNQISLSSGTDLFQRFLTHSIKSGADADFAAVLRHLLSNGQLFAERAKAARAKIASHGKVAIRDGQTILTKGASRCVQGVLEVAARANIRFRVIYVLSSLNDTNGTDMVISLRTHGIPVATVPDAAIAYNMHKVDKVFVGAEGVLQDGGIVSQMGTHQLALLAQIKDKEFFVFAESHKFVRLYPLGQFDLPIEQKATRFYADEDDEAVETWGSRNSSQAPEELHPQLREEIERRERLWAAGAIDNAVDYTPGKLISAIGTETGMLTPSAVADELYKIWL
ncbi:putative translation initiation factor eIF-2B alpha subunit [Phyllosticta citricarpa]|uniref:Translation initiation factor eIF2B subunit alpha n=2 Tax=Phyllosticta TaxID=121621 RepID=A0ABR1M6H0_9PEZI